MDLGINFFDTADVYNNGKSEEILGKAIKGRDHAILRHLILVAINEHEENAALKNFQPIS